jgi:hypothetical protein
MSTQLARHLEDCNGAAVAADGDYGDDESCGRQGRVLAAERRV